MTDGEAKQIIKAIDELGNYAKMFIDLLKEKHKAAKVQEKIGEISQTLAHNLITESMYEVIGVKADGTKIVVCPHQKGLLESLTLEEYHAAADRMLCALAFDRESAIKNFLS